MPFKQKGRGRRHASPTATGLKMLQQTFQSKPAPVMTLSQARVAVIGLGYVGLPLVIAFAHRRGALGFDIDAGRIAALRGGTDANQEVRQDELAAADRLRLSCDAAELAGCNVYIVAVPTPIDSDRRPDLGPLLAATNTVGARLQRGDMVIYESTVFPGATEEICVPVLERLSGFSLNHDFHVGYSPERVSPGDRSRSLSAIVKVTSGSSPEAADFVDALYREIVTAGTHKASSIKVAEAAKIVENIQRDVNIALANELSIVFSHLGIDSAEVLDAAATKWNFLRINPGLVGGHCIGVDPYYLLHRAAAAGYTPDIIGVARRVNDGMAAHAASRLKGAMAGRGLALQGARVLVMGATFKENCRDARNTRVVDLVQAIAGHGLTVDLCDCVADPQEIAALLPPGLLAELPAEGAGYDAIVLAVPHRQYVSLGAAAIQSRVRANGIFFDLKGAFDRAESDLRL